MRVGSIQFSVVSIQKRTWEPRIPMRVIIVQDLNFRFTFHVLRLTSYDPWEHRRLACSIHKRLYPQRTAVSPGKICWEPRIPMRVGSIQFSVVSIQEKTREQRRLACSVHKRLYPHWNAGLPGILCWDRGLPARSYSPSSSS